MDVAELNSLDRTRAEAALGNCCGSGVWVDRMLSARPFSGTTALLAVAEEVWWDLGADDWQEAFATHLPDEATADYLLRFGYPYVVSSANRSQEELANAYTERLGHDALTELSVAAAEQARITNLRLRRLFDLG